MKVRVLKTLKSGKIIREEGIYESPLPPDIAEELRLGTGTVEVVHEEFTPRQLPVKDSGPIQTMTFNSMF